MDKKDIVEYTNTCKVSVQVEEKKKFPTLTKPVQYSVVPLLSLPQFAQDGRKWGKHPGISAQLRELSAREEGVWN